MNKSEFIKELSKQTSYNEERCNTINNIVEDTFIIGKKNKEKIIENQVLKKTSISYKLHINQTHIHSGMRMQVIHILMQQQEKLV